MRRRLIIACICLVLGAVVNVLAAWGIAVSLRDPQWRGWRSDPEEIVWPTPPPGPWPEPAQRGLHTAFGFRYDQSAVRISNNGHFTEHIMGLRSYGWPALSLRTYDVGVNRDYRFSRSWSGQYYEGMTPPEFLKKNPIIYNRLALKPLWPGSAINTAFHGALVWLVGFGPFALRRVLRVRRGRCLRCGYDLAGLDRCPECGAERPGGVSQEQVNET